jgi:hypothetical protein
MLDMARLMDMPNPVRKKDTTIRGKGAVTTMGM